MKERKYKEDYGFRSYIDGRGREKREAVYQGNYFQYQGGAAEKKKTLIQAGVCTLLFSAFYLIYILLNSPSTYCMYVLPLACCALVVLAYWMMGLFAMWRAPEKMTRLQKENGIGRVLRSSIGCTVILLMAAVGDIIFMLVSLKENAANEIPGFALLCCAAMSAMGCFLRIRESYNRMITLYQSKGGSSK